MDSEYRDGLGGHQISRRNVLRGSATLGTGIAAAALIGCSSSKTSSPGGGGTPTGSSAAGTTPAGVKRGGRFTLAVDGDPPSGFDLHAGSTSNGSYMITPAYNQLVQFDPLVAVESPQSIIPDLAEKWEISPDGQTYTFRLAKGVKFHDGTPFTSADVKASLLRQQKPPAGVVAIRSTQLSAISTMETPDDSTIVLKLSRPTSPDSMLPILGQGWMGIYSKKDMDSTPDLYKKGMNGTGPYRFKSYDPGTKISLDKNPDYFIKGRPYLDGVDVFIIPEASTRMAQFQSGGLVLGSSSITDEPILRKAMGDKVDIQTVVGICSSTLNFSPKQAPYTDERVRAAISLAINRADAIQILSKGDAIVGGYMPQGGPWALPEADLKKVPGYGPFSDASIAEAKKLLSAAGVNAPLSPVVLVRNPKNDQDQGLMVVDQLKKLGWNGRIDAREISTAFARFNSGDFEMASTSLCHGLDDPDAVFSVAFLTDSPQNYSRIKNPDVDALYLKQSTELNREKRREMVNELQKLAMPKFGKIIYSWTKRSQAIHSYVKNFKTHTSLYSQGRYDITWFDK